MLSTEFGAKLSRVRTQHRDFCIKYLKNNKNCWQKMKVVSESTPKY